MSALTEYRDEEVFGISGKWTPLIQNKNVQTLCSQEKISVSFTEGGTSAQTKGK